MSFEGVNIHCLGVARSGGVGWGVGVVLHQIFGSQVQHSKKLDSIGAKVL